MQIYVVAKMTDTEQLQESETVGAFVDKERADAAAKKIDAARVAGEYGIVETVELDLTGLQSHSAAERAMLEALNDLGWECH